MIRIVCAVFDSAAQTFGQPIFVAAAGQATRSFADEVQRRASDNVMNQHPEDFALFKLCEYDDTNGHMIVNGAPEMLIRGKDCAIKEN